MPSGLHEAKKLRNTDQTREILLGPEKCRSGQRNIDQAREM